MRERFVKADGVRLHLIEYGTDSSHLPLVCLAGGLGTAEMFTATLSALEPRRGFALTKRGTGKSDKPRSGYGPETQTQDLLDVLGQIHPGPVFLLAYSAAVPVGMLAAGKAPGRVGGLILCDYPAIFPKVAPSYVKLVTSDPHYDPEDCPRRVLEAIVRESERRELDAVLPTIECRALVVHGLGEGSYMKPEHLSTYADRLRNVRIVGIEGAGHGFILTHADAFLSALRQFLGEIDP